MVDLDRAGLMELLDQLGADNDSTVLEAARALHRMAADSGYRWDDIIRPAEHFSAQADAAPDAGGGADMPDVARQIDRLLRKGVSETLRNDLVEMKRQIADGTLDAEDARYVEALARRLGV